ncbi:MAG: BLUF domain-containing protein [Bdellovibrio sp.]|nr:BLUF domain-containing protein [Methylotenera sp.]
MTSLIQLIYISRSTFAPAELSNIIEPNVARILLKSRVNNKKNGLVGVLYFGDGCFFQCLEGTAESVDQLYETLLNDTRHKDLKILSRKSIDALSFSDWSMKHVQLEDGMIKLLKSQGLKTFDPYNFNAEMTKNALELLHSTKDVTDAVLLEDVNLQASQLDNQITQTPARQTDYKSLILYALIVLVLLGSLVIFLK